MCSNYTKNPTKLLSKSSRLNLKFKENSPIVQTIARLIAMEKIPEEEEHKAKYLQPQEVKTCLILRLLPSQYLRCKQVLLDTWYEKGPFKKRDAQRLCRIDVNKTARLYDWFQNLGWFSQVEDDKLIDEEIKLGVDISATA
ncbi:Transcriptional adapter ada2 [Clydaea vesicula]|uniref:Transcriptional adapter ada2 n=1 Tax=Clydaea vesicula TaxID=447962 RepID=A0AAD5XW25_9FUNG|nr:Transcriptional adapter ada2 [Clydaea vesicula]